VAIFKKTQGKKKWGKMEKGGNSKRGKRPFNRKHKNKKQGRLGKGPRIILGKSLPDVGTEQKLLQGEESPKPWGDLKKSVLRMIGPKGGGEKDVDGGEKKKKKRENFNGGNSGTKPWTGSSHG